MVYLEREKRQGTRSFGFYWTPLWIAIIVSSSVPPNQTKTSTMTFDIWRPITRRQTRQTKISPDTKYLVLITHLGGFGTLVDHRFSLVETNTRLPIGPFCSPLIPWANDCMRDGATETSAEVQLLTRCMLQTRTGNNFAPRHDMVPHTILIYLPSQWASQFMNVTWVDLFLMRKIHNQELRKCKSKWFFGNIRQHYVGFKVTWRNRALPCFNRNDPTLRLWASKPTITQWNVGEWTCSRWNK